MGKCSQKIVRKKPYWIKKLYKLANPTYNDRKAYILKRIFLLSTYIHTNGTVISDKIFGYVPYRQNIYCVPLHNQQNRQKYKFPLEYKSLQLKDMKIYLRINFSISECVILSIMDPAGMISSIAFN